MSNYEKFMAVLKKWPVCPDRNNRDYGRHLRSLLVVGKEEIFPGSAAENSKMLDSLLRLTENKWFKKHSYTKGATGLKLDNIKVFLSDTYQKQQKK